MDEKYYSIGDNEEVARQLAQNLAEQRSFEGLQGKMEGGLRFDAFHELQEPSQVEAALSAGLLVIKKTDQYFTLLNKDRLTELVGEIPLAA